MIFADTGEEHPYTISYIRERIVPYCRDQGIHFATVRSDKGRLVDYFTKARAIPSMTHRDCTTKFKVRPIRGELRRRGVTEAICLLGIALDEATRMKTSDVKWITNEYPLVEWRMTRADCEATIAGKGWPSPGKSGCRGCIFGGAKVMTQLLQEDPREFARWQAMEEAGSRFPEFTLVRGTTMDALKASIRTQKRITDFDDEKPCEGHCLT